MHSTRIATIITKKFALVRLTETFQSETPKKVLAFDIDNTMLDPLSVKLSTICLKKEKELREALDAALEKGVELVIVTSRAYDLQISLKDHPYLSIDALLKKLDKPYFSAIYFTSKKHDALVDLSHRFKTKKIILVDDLERNRSPDFGFFQVDAPDTYKKIQQFISPVTSIEILPLLEKEEYQKAFEFKEHPKELWRDLHTPLHKNFLKHIKENEVLKLEDLLTFCPQKIKFYLFNESKESPLCMAATLENIAIIKILSTFGATDDSADFHEKIVLFLKNSVRNKNYVTIEEILKLYPETLNTEGLVNWAVAEGDPDFIKLIGKYNRQALSPKHAPISPLHSAISLFNENCIKALIEAKADIEIRNRDNMTALQHAFRYGIILAIKELLKADADPFPDGRKPSECIFHPRIYAKVTLTQLEEYIETRWPNEEKRPSLAKKHLIAINDSSDDVSTLNDIQESMKNEQTTSSFPCFFSSTQIEDMPEYIDIFSEHSKMLDRLIEARSNTKKLKLELSFHG